jgi:uncharacterized membrane protein
MAEPDRHTMTYAADPDAEPLTGQTERSDENNSYIVLGDLLEPQDIRAEIRAQAQLNQLQIRDLRNLKQVQKLNIRSLRVLTAIVVFVALLGVAGGIFHVLQAATFTAEYQTGYAYSVAIVLMVLFALALIMHVIDLIILKVRLKVDKIEALLTEHNEALEEAAPFMRSGYSQ